MIVAILIMLVAPPGATAGGQSAEQLADVGAWRAAADSFLARAERQPDRAAHWYNAGVALAAADAPQRAWVAWRRAARLAPRDAVVRVVLRSVPNDALTDRMAPVYPVRAEELWLLGALLWAGAWVLFGVRRRVAGLLVLVCAAGATAGGLAIQRVYRQPIALAVADAVPLREAPYGTAASARTLAAGAAARVLRVDGRWMLVARGAAEGWVLVGEMVRL